MADSMNIWNCRWIGADWAVKVFPMKKKYERKWRKPADKTALKKWRFNISTAVNLGFQDVCWSKKLRPVGTQSGRRWNIERDTRPFLFLLLFLLSQRPLQWRKEWIHSDSNLSELLINQLKEWNECSGHWTTPVGKPKNKTKK